MKFKHNLVRTPVTDAFDTGSLRYPKDRFDLISVDYVDTWEQLQKHTKGDGSVVTYTHHGHSTTITLKCKRCGEIKQVVDRPTISCKNGPCNIAWVDLTGKKFGRLTALKYVYGAYRAKEKERWYWLCRCDCGSECYKTAHDLVIAGHKECRACARQRNIETTTLPGDLAKWHREYRTARHSASARNYQFAISFDEFYEMCHQPCYYCGEEPEVRASGLVKNGIDRFDNTKGYVSDNIVACCPMCNRMKNSYAPQEWLAHIEKIHKHMKERSTTISQESTPKQAETDSDQIEEVTQPEETSFDVQPDLGF